MILYILIIVLFLIGIYAYDIKNNKYRKLEYYYFICIYLTLLAGLSYRLGSDGPSYEEWFNEIPSLDNLKKADFEYSSVQPLFLILGSLSKFIINDVWLFHSIQSGIVCFTTFWFIRKYTKYIFTAGLVFVVCIYTYFCFEIWKESLAISMIIIAYYYLDRNQWGKYVIYGVIGFLFHFSGLIFILIPILKRLKFNLIFFIIIGILWVLFEAIVQYMQVFMYSDLLIAKYDRYMEVKDNLNATWYLMSFCKNVIAPMVIGLWFKLLFSKFEFEWSYGTYVLLGIGALQFAVIFERPTNYFLPFIVVSISQLIGLSKRFHKNLFITVVLSFMFCISCRLPFFLSHEGWRVLIPYESVFTKEKNSEREKTISIIHVG